MIEIRWIGRGGQGAFTAAKILGEAVIQRQGYDALAFPSFGPERRGAPLEAYTKIDTKKLVNRTVIQKANYMIILDETLYQDRLLDDLKRNGTLILNTAKSGYDHRVICIDALHIALQHLKRPITNTAMLGALAAVCDFVSIDQITKTLERYFSRPILKNNISVLHAAYEEVSHEKAKA